MPESLQELLLELETFGINNDFSIADRPLRMLNITRDTGEFLSVLVGATNAKKILEIGTSNGYSTLWLASAARSVGGSVTTVELSDYKVSLAQKNFSRAGLSSFIAQVHGEAGALLSNSTESSFDFIFLDSERSEYTNWWPEIKRVLRQGGLLVVDNATSHYEEMKSFIELVQADANFSTCIVPVGNGEFLANSALAG